MPHVVLSRPPASVHVTLADGSKRSVLADDLFRLTSSFEEDLVGLAAACGRDVRPDDILGWERHFPSGHRFDVAVVSKSDPDLGSTVVEVHARDAVEACAIAAWLVSHGASRRNGETPSANFPRALEAFAYFPEFNRITTAEMLEILQKVAHRSAETRRVLGSATGSGASDRRVAGTILREEASLNDGRHHLVRFRSDDPVLSRHNLSIVASRDGWSGDLAGWLRSLAGEVADRFVPDDARDRRARLDEVRSRLRIVSADRIGDRRYLDGWIKLRTSSGFVRAVNVAFHCVDAEDMRVGTILTSIGHAGATFDTQIREIRRIDRSVRIDHVRADMHSQDEVEDILRRACERMLAVGDTNLRDREIAQTCRDVLSSTEPTTTTDAIRKHLLSPLVASLDGVSGLEPMTIEETRSVMTNVGAVVVTISEAVDGMSVDASVGARAAGTATGNRTRRRTR